MEDWTKYKISKETIKIQQAIRLEEIDAIKDKIKEGQYITLDGAAFRHTTKVTGGYDYSGKTEGQIIKKYPHIFVIDCGHYKSAIRYAQLATEGTSYKLKG